MLGESAAFADSERETDVEIRVVMSSDSQFESRKVDHIRLALDPGTQTSGASGLDHVRLRHEAFPELDFEQIDPVTSSFFGSARTPMFISSMTAGHAASGDLNLIMARVCEARNWPMGVGSQRKELFDSAASIEWTRIRKQCRGVRFFGNIGIAQLIRTSTDDIRRLAEALDASAMIVHTNPLQECLQPEGTPQFAGGLRAIERLVRELGRPVIVKETGCGFSTSSLRRLCGLGVAAVDISGMGGTHWGRVEGGRSPKGSMLHRAADTFRDWGVGTVESLRLALALEPKDESDRLGSSVAIPRQGPSDRLDSSARPLRDYEVWASGGVRSGLDAAKLVAMGARMVGLAKPILEAALEGEDALNSALERLEYEFKMALFCTGSRTVLELRGKHVWE